MVQIESPNGSEPEYNSGTMPLPLIPIAIGALFGKAATKKEGKEQFQAVKGRKRKDGTVGKAYLRRKPKSR